MVGYTLRQDDCKAIVQSAGDRACDRKAAIPAQQMTGQPASI
ncbi:hypothetical protein OOK60_15935 [Trichothermofontia sichuanensis B231]|nr:hypothetical protein [Trichothermofontia sichuanensis]UZQ53962.1 hypothetical protein OOK60_15935 [Trichothermofontia sichuanensis B231]